MQILQLFFGSIKNLSYHDYHIEIEMSDTLPANGQNTLTLNQTLRSQNSQYTLILRADGLALERQPHIPIWGPTPLNPPGSQASTAVIKPDGNFVVEDTSGAVLWSTDTAEHPGAHVVIQNDGLLVVYDKDLPLWASDSDGDANDSASWNSVLGTQQVTPQGAGVMGVSHDNYGVFRHSKKNDAVHGQTDSDTRAGVWGECSGKGDGVHGQSNGTGAAVAGYAMGAGRAGFFQGDVKVTGNLSAASLSAPEIDFTQPISIHISNAVGFALAVTNDLNGAIWAKAGGAGVPNGNVAGHFDGDIEVTGDVKLLGGSDCAEEFDLSSTEYIEPGSVMVLNQSGN